MFVNMVLEDVTEYEITPEGKKVGAGSLGSADPTPPLAVADRLGCSCLRRVFQRCTAGFRPWRP